MRTVWRLNKWSLFSPSVSTTCCDHSHGPSLTTFFDKKNASTIHQMVQRDHPRLRRKRDNIQAEASGIQTWRAGKSWKIHHVVCWFSKRLPHLFIYIYFGGISQLATFDYPWRIIPFNIPLSIHHYQWFAFLNHYFPIANPFFPHIYCRVFGYESDLRNQTGEAEISPPLAARPMQSDCRFSRYGLRWMSMTSLYFIRMNWTDGFIAI